jgi:glutathione S-transferase
MGWRWATEETVMKLYNSVGPNPRIVRMFMAERGAVADLVRVDLRRAENRGEAFLQKNPTGTLPALELDDGTVLSEITAICEYIDEVTPGPSLIGATPVERAQTRMWTRRIDLNIAEPMAQGYRYSDGLPIFANRMRCIPEAAATLKLIAAEKLAWLDGLMEGHDFVCQDRFSLADILLFAFLDFGAKVGQPFDPELSAIPGWFAAMAARPSASA